MSRTTDALVPGERVVIAGLVSAKEDADAVFDGRFARTREVFFEAETPSALRDLARAHSSDLYVTDHR